MNRYRKGYEVELKAKKELEEKGYTVIRSAGSFGLWDLIAMNKKSIRLIQVKRMKREPYSIRKVKKELLSFHNYPLFFCVKELWVWVDGKGWVSKKIIPYAHPQESFIKQKDNQKKA